MPLIKELFFGNMFLISKCFLMGVHSKVSIAVIKYYDQKHLGEERISLILHFVVYLLGKLVQKPKTEAGDRD